MPYTFANLKRDVRRDIWPAGESRNQFVAHNKSFVDALVDIQTWAECWQIDNTQLVPHCATYFNCGLTVFDAPRGIITQLSVIDKELDDEGNPDPEGADDYCSEIVYQPVDFCHIKRYLNQSSRAGCCFNIPLYFAIPPAMCGLKGVVPVPTDEGVPVGLPILPLGNHYPQTSTDASRRATAGVWAIERGRIYVAPWINSTETILMKWDGIKRDWTDGDLVEEDPELLRAVEMFLRKDHAAKFDLQMDKAQEWERWYNIALSNLVHACRQETMRRDCKQSVARGSRITALFYNDAQQYTASCPPNEDGDDVTVTVPADSVGSIVSKSDANAKALDQARSQAEARLDCDTPAVTYWNTEQVYTAECEVTDGAPMPEGSAVTATIAANLFSSTVSQAAANAMALAAAQEQAEAQLECVYWNAEQEYTAECPEGEEGDPVTVTIPEHTYSSTVSQLLADQAALNAAKAEAEEQLATEEGCATVYFNVARSYTKTATCPTCFVLLPGQIGYCPPGSVCPPLPGVPSLTGPLSVTVTVAANHVTSIISQADANERAYNMARQIAEAQWSSRCGSHNCGVFNVTIP